MHLGCWGQLSLSFTLLAKRMSRNVAVTYSFPCTTISLTSCWIAVILFIPCGFLFSMFFTKTSVSQLWTTRVRAWSLRFPWHTTPPFAHRKSPRRRNAPVKASVCYYSILPLYSFPYGQTVSSYANLCQSVPTFI